MTDPRLSIRRCLLFVAAVIALGASVPAIAGAATLYVSGFSSFSVSAYSIGADGTPAPVTCDPATACHGGKGGAIAVDPTASHVYVANDANPGSLSAWSIGAGGVLAPIACDPTTTCKTGASSEAVAITPDGRHLYVGNEGSASVSVFSLGPDGVPAPVACDPLTACKTGIGPTGVAIDPTGTHLYVANNSDSSVSVFSIGADGVLTHVACDPATICKTGPGPNGVAIDPSGAHLYVTNGNSVSVFSIGAGGVLSPVTCDPATICKTGNAAVAVAVDPSGSHLYVSNSGSGAGGNSVSVFSIGADGLLAPVTCDPATICKTGQTPDGLAIEATGKHLYTSNNNASSVSAFSIGAGGALAPIPCDPMTACKAANFPDYFSAALTPDRGPIATFSAAPASAGSPSSFNAAASSSPDYPIVDYAWDFGDGQTQTTTGPSTTHSYAQPGNYAVTLTVTDAAGCSRSIVFTGQTAYCNGSSKATATQPVTIAAALRVGSVVDLKITPTTIVAAPSGASVGAAAAKRRKFGGIVSYVESQPATTAFTVQRPAAGRRVGGRCVKPSKSNRSRKRCTRFVAVGGFTHVDAVGANRFRFRGRLRGHKLRPGRYRLRAIPRNAAGTGRAAFKPFRVKKR
jgi:DNA-binding beta-propeller fold protein YncE